MTELQTAEGGNMDKRWALYVRVSTRQQVDGFSLDDQKDKLISYAESQGWEWIVFEDPGVSGERLADRPGLSALLDAVDKDDLHGVIVLDESRLARDDLVAAQIRDRFKRAGVLIATPTRGVLDLNEPTEKFMASVIAAAHVFDQDLRRSKMMTGLRRTAEAGYWPGGPAPYGYKLVPSEDGKHTVLAIQDEEKKVLRLAADLIVKRGYTTYSSAAHLNGIGVRTRSGTPWKHTNLSWQLRKTHSTGTFIYNAQGEDIAISIPHIFGQNEWDELQREIKGQPRSHRKNRLYPLTGKGRCHLTCACGGNFFGFTDTSKKQKTVYQCARHDHALGAERCPHRPRVTPAELLEAHVWEQVIAALTNTDYLTSLAMSHLASMSSDDERRHIGGLRRNLSRLRTQETNIIRQLAENEDLHGNALTRALGEIEADRLTVEKELSRIEEAQRGTITVESVPEAALRLSRLAEARLATPTTELMAEVFDLLEVDLIRIEGRTFEGVARLPLPDVETNGEVWKGALRAPALPQRLFGRAVVSTPLSRGLAG